MQSCGSNDRSASAASASATPECTADLEFVPSLSTRKRVWTSRIDYPAARQHVDPSTTTKNSSNEEVRQCVINFSLGVISYATYFDYKVLKAVDDGFKVLCARFDTLEANLRETLRKTSTDLKANTTELESLSAMVRLSQPGRQPHPDHQHESKPDATPTSQDLLRRLKRGYLLQYECDDDDEIDGARPASRAINIIETLKREVALST
jgi:hypothetical protein